MAGGFGGAGRGGKKKLFDDRLPPIKDGGGSAAAKEAYAARERQERLQAHISYKPRERYPPMHYPVTPLPTQREYAVIETWKAERKRARDGPLFVRRVVDSNARVAKARVAAPGATAVDAFNALQTYSTKYERKWRVRPKFAGKLWLKAILPEELWDVVDPSLRKARAENGAQDGSGNGRGSATAKPTFNLDDFSDGDEDGDDENADKENADDSDAEGEAEPEEVDEDWEDDEDEADDYNGEKYFDDGEADDVVGDDYEAGDDLGGGEVEHEREFAIGEEFDV
ncbi:hypothetical protein, variant [Verruconis gallopava]|uniref:DNA-directed RNA polymerase III subunit n=1 Tax=Verruconis gallopava TaxID=253628 RepID=A0A0D1XZQ2_9PEZI|nr:hypothetical protein, variant [Verruconis gallopava]KIW08286.1 hypothetical protein, variant [Verruconis gallopava]